jgi:hypothetical protein
VGHARCNPIHFPIIPVYCEKTVDCSKHAKAISKQITKYFSDKDAALTEEMMGGAEKFKNKSKAIILKFHPHYVTKRD